MPAPITFDFGLQLFEQRTTSFTVTTNGACIHSMIPTLRSALIASVTAFVVGDAADRDSLYAEELPAGTACVFRTFPIRRYGSAGILLPIR